MWFLLLYIHIFVNILRKSDNILMFKFINQIFKKKIKTKLCSSEIKKTFKIKNMFIWNKKKQILIIKN